MIFLKLFWVFSYIGLFNFGGGYAMLSFIQQEVVVKHHWVTQAEFTDMVAISQMTPGPIGINCATYTGYTSVINDPWVQETFGNGSNVSEGTATSFIPHLLGILGSILATFSVIWLPFIVMIMVSKLILRYKESIVTKSIFAILRPAIIGLLASASLSLINLSNFGDPDVSLFQFCLSIIICLTVFFGVRIYKWNIIYTIFACGMIGVMVYAPW